MNSVVKGMFDFLRARGCAGTTLLVNDQGINLSIDEWLIEGKNYALGRREGKFVYLQRKGPAFSVVIFRNLSGLLEGEAEGGNYTWELDNSVRRKIARKFGLSVVDCARLLHHRPHPKHPTMTLEEYFPDDEGYSCAAIEEPVAN